MYQAFCLHRYSYVKALTHNGFHMVRPYKSMAFVGPMAAFLTLGLTTFSGKLIDVIVNIIVNIIANN